MKPIRMAVFAVRYILTYKQLKREFGCVTTYKSIRRKYIDNVHKFIDDYALPMALAEQVKEANAQISMSF